MRGAQRILHHPIAVRRIIPAYAGSTHTAGPSWWPTWDHPRVCGEHDVWQSFQFDVKGIIPAYAGSTQHCWWLLTHWRDHPRVCGEHGHVLSWSTIKEGSSPRMRGAPAQGRGRRSRHGIIPAYAGSTTRTVSAPKADEDHPRVCGEHFGSQIRREAE